MSGWQPIDTMPVEGREYWLRSQDDGPCKGWGFRSLVNGMIVCFRAPPILAAQRIDATEWMPITPGEYPWGAFPE